MSAFSPNHRMRSSTAAALLALAVWSEGGQAQGASAPLPIERLLTGPRLAPATAQALSPDGQWLAYTVVDRRRQPKPNPVAVPWYAIGGDIWISDIKGREARSLTRTSGSNWGPSWSPDGRRLAFLSDRGFESDSGAAHLWIWDRASDQRRLATRLPVLDPWGRLGRLEWLADGRTILIKMYPEELSPSAYTSLLKGASEEQRTGSDSGVTAQVFRWDSAGRGVPRPIGPNNLNHLLGDLALVDVKTGAVRRLVRGLRICTYALSPDGRTLAYAVATGFERTGSYRIPVDLFVHDLEQGATRRLVAGAPLVYAYPNYPVFAWSPTSRAIAYRIEGRGIRDEVYVVGLDGGQPRRIADGPILEEPLYAGRPLWEPGGRRVFFVRAGALWQASTDGMHAARLAAHPDRNLRMVEQGSGTLWSPDAGRSTVVITGSRTTKRVGFARVDLRTGAITQLLEEEKWYDTTRADPLVVTRDGKSLVYVAEDAERPSDLWITQGLERMQPRQITRVAPDLAKFTSATAKLIQWQGLDGDTLRGVLILPAFPPAGPGYPLIVKVYGGTSVSDDLNRFGFAGDPVENLHIFTSRGYAVLLADSKLRVGTPMSDLLKTVMPGVERAIASGVVDPNRIGITGHSYGGYSTLGLIVQSRRFKAAVVRAGLADLIGAYGQLGPGGTNYTLSWAEQGQGRMGGTLWEARARYIENSPIFYLDRVTAPVLLIHGGDDRNIPRFLADQVFSSLRRLGKPVEYARYAGESHWEALWSLPNQIDYLTRVTGWFDRHLKAPDGAPTSE